MPETVGSWQIYESDVGGDALYRKKGFPESSSGRKEDHRILRRASEERTVRYILQKKWNGNSGGGGDS